MRIFKISLTLMLLAFGTFSTSTTIAQDDADIEVFAQSGRYSLTITQGWVATTAPQNPRFQAVFPYDSLTVASSKAMFDVLSDFGDADLDEIIAGLGDIDGALIFGTILPGAFINRDTFGSDEFANANLVATDSNFETVPFESNTLDGTRFNFSVQDNRGSALFGFDDNNNVLLLIGASNDANWETFDTVFSSTTYHTFEEEMLYDVDNLSATLEVVPNALELNMPPGWWVIETPDGVMFAPRFDDIVTAFQDEDFESFEDVVMMAFHIDSDDAFIQELLGEDGLGAKGLEELMDLIELFGFSPENGEAIVHDAGAWSNDFGLEGVFLEVELLDRNVHMYAIVVPVEDEFYALATFAGAGQYEQYRELVDATFATARLIEE